MVHSLTTVKNANEYAFLGENREIIKNKKSLESLKTSISERGILQPITVMPFNQENPDHLLKDGKPHLLKHPNDSTELEDVSEVKYLVLDGAHRFVLASEMGIEIPVVVNPMFGRMDIVAMNNLATKWGTEDYIECFANLGVKDYILLQDQIAYWRGRMKISVTDIAIHYNLENTNSASNEIKTMSYKINEAKGDKILNTCLAFKSVPSIQDLQLYSKRSVTVSVSQLLKKYGDMFEPYGMVGYIIKKGILFTKEDNKKEVMQRKLEQIMFDMYDEKTNTSRSYSSDQKKIISMRDGSICRDSKCAVDEYSMLDVDHKNPFNGFNTTINNGQLLCGVEADAHNQKKGDMPYEEWKETQFN